MQAVFFSTRGVEHPLVRRTRSRRTRPRRRAIDALQRPLRQTKREARSAVPASGCSSRRSRSCPSTCRSLEDAAGAADRGAEAQRGADREDAAERFAAREDHREGRRRADAGGREARSTPALVEEIDGARQAEAASRSRRRWRSAKAAASRGRRTSCIAAAPTPGSVMTPGVLSVASDERARVPGAAARREVELAAARPGRVARVAGQPADRAGDGQPASGSIISAKASCARPATSARWASRRRIRSCSTGWRSSSSSAAGA